MGLVLILGGARSGKSSFAQKLAGSKGGNDVIYLATSQVKDQEMRKRVLHHQNDRPASWKTIEEALHVSKALAALPPGRVVMLDCLTLLISNILMKDLTAGEGDYNIIPPGEERDIIQELEEIIKQARERELELIIVSNELGQGLVPPYRLGRIYRDISGRANQLIARAADQVYLIFAGLPMEIKGPGMAILKKIYQGDDEL